MYVFPWTWPFVVVVVVGGVAVLVVVLVVVVLVVLFFLRVHVHYISCHYCTFTMYLFFLMLFVSLEACIKK